MFVDEGKDGESVGGSSDHSLMGFLDKGFGVRDKLLERVISGLEATVRKEVGDVLAESVHSETVRGVVDGFLLLHGSKTEHVWTLFELLADEVFANDCDANTWKAK